MSMKTYQYHVYGLQNPEKLITTEGIKAFCTDHPQITEDIQKRVESLGAGERYFDDLESTQSFFQILCEAFEEQYDVKMEYFSVDEIGYTYIGLTAKYPWDNNSTEAGLSADEFADALMDFLTPLITEISPDKVRDSFDEYTAEYYG